VNQSAWTAMNVVLPVARVTAAITRSTSVRLSRAFRSSSAIA
jgi:hypothetical protein